MEYLIVIFSFISILISLIVILVLLYRTRSHFFWGIFCLISLASFNSIPVFDYFGIPKNPILQNPVLHLSFPLFLYFYSKKILLNTSNFEKNILFQLSPFLLLAIVLGILPPIPPPTEILENQNQSLLMVSLGAIFRFALIFVHLIYYPLTWQLIQKHQEELPNYFAHKNAFNTFIWIKVIVIIGSIVFLITIFLLFAFDPVFNSNQKIFPLWPQNIAFLVFSIVFAIFISQQPILGLEAKEKLPIGININTSIYEYILHLEARMETHKDYLQVQLKIADISKNLDIPTHVLSKAINEHYGYNFFHFINRYRIEHAKTLLQEIDLKQITIDAIGHQSGFKSRATFYKRFKEFTGQTPSLYLKSIQRS